MYKEFVGEYELNQNEAVDESGSKGIWDLSGDFIMDELNNFFPNKVDEIISKGIMDELQTDLYEVIKTIIRKVAK